MSTQPNRVLLAFIRGRQEAEEREKNEEIANARSHQLTLQEADQIATEKFRRDQLKQRETEFDADFKLKQEANSLALKVQRANELRRLREDFASGKIKPNARTGVPSLEPDAIESALGDIIPIRELSTASDVGRAALEQNAPLLEAKAEADASKVAQQFDLRGKLEETKAKYAKEIMGIREDRADARAQDSNATRIAAANISASASRDNARMINERMLEIAKLKGTTGAKPKLLSDSEQKRFNALVEINRQIEEIKELGDKTGYKLHHGLGGEMRYKARKMFEFTKPEEDAYASKLYDIFSTQSHERFGGALTPTELGLLRNYATSLSESGSSAKTKIRQLHTKMRSALQDIGRQPAFEGNIKYPPKDMGIKEKLPDGTTLHWNFTTGQYDKE